jgi:hypothetical protein
VKKLVKGMLGTSGYFNINDKKGWMLLHFVVNSGKEVMVELLQPQYNTYNIYYRQVTHELKKKSCWKGIDTRFSNFGPLLQDFVDDDNKGVRHQMGDENQAQQGMTFLLKNYM